MIFFYTPAARASINLIIKQINNDNIKKNSKYLKNKKYGFITPLKPKKHIQYSEPKIFATLDIETVNVNGLQIPICITIA